MKNTFIRFTILTLFFNYYSGIAQIHSSKLLGKWELDYNSTSALMEADVKKVFNSLPEVNHSTIEKVYKGRQMIFMNNNIFELKLSDGRSSIGMWELNLEEKVLKIKNQKNNKEYFYKIVSLTSETLLIEELEVKGTSYFKKLH
ncbi:hypothetical protein, partial [Flavobacterium seoulense]|uniref:hypothetical protein n=1 Tax=Flavobacterium seoulense TaxID=1492738 RepID=UPI0005565FEC